MKYFYYSKTDNTFYIKKKYRNSNKDDRYTDDIDLKEVDNSDVFIDELHEIFEFENPKISFYPVIRDTLVVVINSEKMPLYLHNVDIKTLDKLILNFSISKEFKIISTSCLKLSDEAKLKIELS